MKGHETRRGSHGKKRDDKVQQKGRGVTESKGNAKESGSCHSPVETAAPRQVAVAAGCPAASRSGGKNPTRRSDVRQLGGPADCTPQTGKSLVMGKSLDRQKKGEKRSF